MHHPQKGRMLGRKPFRLEKKRKNNPASHLSIAQALTTIGGSSAPTHDQVVVECGATHHMFNSPKSFLEQFKKSTPKLQQEIQIVNCDLQE
ncbi:hypothetical protein O181_093302 [Austropuccinia psidii MF-1]|uniref:Uncharacterized protein n=1 Tax=Austropuccinia psidii MF-1 TaxID=1389203 RepID=A0A9Q3J0S5_9BASI|nr:hypothetical protein [Austropuccinia psidii MF-1]